MARRRAPSSLPAKSQFLRPMALGRRNWLFGGSDEGAKRLAILYTLRNRSLQGTLPMPHGLCYPRGPVLAAMAWTALTSTAAAAARPGGSAASCG